VARPRRATGKDLPDVLKWVKFSGAAWTKDGKGFFYSRYDEPGEDALQAASTRTRSSTTTASGPRRREDVLVYERKDSRSGATTPTRHRRRALPRDQRVGGLRRQERAVLCRTSRPGVGKGKVVELLPSFDGQYDFVDNDGPVFYLTDEGRAARAS
jgi:prolyl oligopeptidase